MSAEKVLQSIELEPEKYMLEKHGGRGKTRKDQIESLFVALTPSSPNRLLPFSPRHHLSTHIQPNNPSTPPP